MKKYIYNVTCEVINQFEVEAENETEAYSKLWNEISSTDLNEYEVGDYIIDLDEPNEIMDTSYQHNKALVSRINDIYKEKGVQVFVDYIQKYRPDWEKCGEGNKYDYVHLFLQMYCNDYDLLQIIEFTLK